MTTAPLPKMAMHPSRKSSARHQNPRRFSESERAFIREAHKEKTIAEMSRELGRHFQSVQSFMQANGFFQLRATVKRQNLEPLQRLPKLELAYLAGIIDGEGTVSVRRHYHKRNKKSYYSASVWATNTSDLLQKWLEARGFSCHLYTSTLGKPCWKMTIDGMRAAVVCRALLPWLVIKRQHAVLLMEFCKIRMGQETRAKPTARMLQIYQEIRRLNWRCAAPDEFSSTRASATTTS